MPVPGNEYHCDSCFFLVTSVDNLCLYFLYFNFFLGLDTGLEILLITSKHNKWYTDYLKINHTNWNLRNMVLTL